MCQNTHLHHSNKAFITYCYACKHIQMAFGTTAVRFTEEQFQEFCEYVLGFYPKCDKHCPLKKNWIPLLEKTTCLLLSGKELYELREVLADAQNALVLARLLDKTNLSQN